MKLPLFLFLSGITSISLCQNYKGLWKGEINQANSIIQIEFNVMIQDDSSVFAMMTKPEMALFCDSTYCGDTLFLKSSKYNIGYKAVLSENLNQLSGEFFMDGTVYPLNVNRGESPIFRPQLPKKPYPYHTEEIFFQNIEDSVTLSGTLTVPDSIGLFPAVVLISGSSPNDRDYENFYHKPFLVLADYLTRKGIIVLRYDDRGVNKSSGNFYQSTPVNFAKDIEAGINYLKSRNEVDKDKIGQIGHSGGGLVASIAASQNEDISFIVLLAAPGIGLKEVFLSQNKYLFEHGDLSEERYKVLDDFHNYAYQLIQKNTDTHTAIDSLNKFKKDFIENYRKAGIDTFDFSPELLFDWMLKVTLSPYNRFNITCNPADYLKMVTCPVLSLNGNKDLQVSSKINQDAIKAALETGNNNNYKIIELEGLNHNFQRCITCSEMEGKDLEETFSVDALEVIGNWILLVNK